MSEQFDETAAGAGSEWPTLDQVAKMAGVSRATISRVLNSPHIVSANTAARVRVAIDSLGYVPNLLAGGLASNRSKLIAAFIPNAAHSVFGESVQIMTDELVRAGFEITLGLTGSHDEHMDRTLRAMLGRRPNGIVVTGVVTAPATRRLITASRIPTVETWDLPAEPIDMVVGFSQEKAGHCVAQYVLKKGYRRPLVLTADGRRAQTRHAGFAGVMHDAGMGDIQQIIVPVPTTFTQGRQSLAQFLNAGGTADVVVCSSDWMAYGVIAEAHSRDMRIPDDLAVIGFGNMDFAGDTHPALTTVHIDGAHIGRQAATFLLQRSQGVQPETRVVDVGFNIVERASG